MTATLDGRIADLIETKLATITVANGYQTSVVTVSRPPVAHYSHSTSEMPAASLRELRKDVRFHLRGAEELRLGFQIVLSVAIADGDTDGATAIAALKALIADVKKLVYANLRWNNGSENLAQRTWVVEDSAHEPEVAEDRVSGQVVIEVLARASTSDPTAVKAI